MPKLKHPEDFTLDGGLGYCKICNGSTAKDPSWTKIGNLRAHEKQKLHMKNAANARANRKKGSESRVAGRRPLQTYVEDCPDEDSPPPATESIPWFSAPAVDNESGAGISSGDDRFVTEDTGPHGSLHTHSLPAELQEALSGAVDFSSAEMATPQGLSEVTLEDVLSGAGLLEAVMDQEDSEERPLPPSTIGGAGYDPSDEDVFASERLPVPTAEDVSQALFGSPVAPRDFFPYPNSGMMKTDFLFSSPTIRFSRSQKEAVLAWGKDMGAKDVPTLYGLEKFQATALAAVGDPTEKVQASSGNVFYMNTVNQALARDYANEAKRRQMHVHPEFTGKVVREAWQASKWLVDAPDAVLTPMTRVRGKDFFVNELAYCTDKSWFIPTRFFEFDGALWAKGHPVAESKAGLVVAKGMAVRPCSLFDVPWPDIEARTKDKNVFAPESSDFAQMMPHSDRLLAAGLEVESPALIVFIDDVSGNSSKQWNVHYSCYLSNAGLPRTELEKDGNIRFVATSPHASPMEIIRAVCEELKKSSAKPFKVWDAVKRRHVLIRPWILFLPGDNPMQAELCSHIGLQGNHFCRICHVGGDTEFKSSNDGFASLMVPGPPRKVVKTREAVMAQLAASTHAAAEKPVKNLITTSGVKDSFAVPVLNELIAKGKILRRATPARKALSPEQVNAELYAELMKKRDVPLLNPLLDMEGLDIHLDTPVEPLHTHLLGVVKYFWAQTVWVLEKQGKFAEFQARLNSLSRLGLKVPNIMADYMCRYRGGLIGKHFKTISQVMIFAIAGLVDQTLQDTWLSIGHLTVLIWETEITDVKKFADELRVVIQETIDFAAALSPGLLTQKNKFHILAHLPDNIERFGPALLFSTERYESFNHIFRLCSIHSNRQAPSRDIAKTFANQDRCRHMASGGFWYDKTRHSWVQAGDGVLRHISDHPIDARLLGLTPEKHVNPGDMTLLPLPPRVKGRPAPEHPVVSWPEVESSHDFQPPLSPRRGKWHRAASVVTLSGDTAQIGSEVIVRATPGREASPLAPLQERQPRDGPGNHTESFASVLDILRPTSLGAATSEAWVIIRDSVIQPDLHPSLKLPAIKRDGKIRLVRPEAIVCAVNVQHDCFAGKCMEALGTQHLRQERQESTRTRAVVKHTESATKYVINLAALHNQSRIRACLPAALCARPAAFSDRAGLHKRAAESLRDKKLQKKLAREAAIRKSAEAALRSSTAKGACGDVYNLADDPTAVSPSDPGHEAPADGEQPVPPEEMSSPSPAHTRTATPLPIVASTTSAPRGPRQRRGVKPSGLAPAGGVLISSPMAASSSAAPRGTVEGRLHVSQPTSVSQGATGTPDAVARMPGDAVSPLTPQPAARIPGIGLPARSPANDPDAAPPPLEPPAHSAAAARKPATSSGDSGPPAAKRRKVRAQVNPEASAERETMFRDMFNGFGR